MTSSFQPGDPATSTPTTTDARWGQLKPSRRGQCKPSFSSGPVMHESRFPRIPGGTSIPPGCAPGDESGTLDRADLAAASPSCESVPAFTAGSCFGAIVCKISASTGARIWGRPGHRPDWPLALAHRRNQGRDGGAQNRGAAYAAPPPRPASAASPGPPPRTVGIGRLRSSATAGSGTEWAIASSPLRSSDARSREGESDRRAAWRTVIAFRRKGSSRAAATAAPPGRTPGPR